MKLPKLKSYKVNGILITESSGNLWRDAGFPDAEERQAKSNLAIAIRRRIESLGLTQSAAARRLGIHQPRMSEIWNNHVDGYTIDKLSEMLFRLGATVRITIDFTEKSGGYQVLVP